MPKVVIRRWSGLLWLGPLLACSVLRQTPQPIPTLERLSFEIQTATPTVSLLLDVPTATRDPNASPTATATLTATQTVSVAGTVEPTNEPASSAPSTPAPVEPAESAAAVEPVAAPPTEAPVATVNDRLSGGEWDFEAGFVDWANPYGDRCDGAGLAVGWTAFTTRDQFGSSCFNQTTWRANVYSGESAQEITFAFVGNEAGILRSTATTPSHRYIVEAFVRREPSPAKVQVWLGIDLAGGSDWQADTVAWFPWDDDTEDQWTRTEETITATGETMTVYIRGQHPEPVGGGALRIDAISIVDLGPEG